MTSLKSLAAVSLLAVCLFVGLALTPGGSGGNGGVASFLSPVLVSEAEATTPPGICFAYEDGRHKVIYSGNGRYSVYECRHSWWYGWDWWFIGYIYP